MGVPAMIESTRTLAFAPPAAAYRPVPAAYAQRTAARRRHDRWQAWLWAPALLLLIGTGTLALLVRGRPVLRALWHSYGIGAAGDILSAALPVSAALPADSAGVQLPVQNILQNPELPNAARSPPPPSPLIISAIRPTNAFLPPSTCPAKRPTTLPTPSRCIWATHSAAAAGTTA